MKSLKLASIFLAAIVFAFCMLPFFGCDSANGDDTEKNDGKNLKFTKFDNVVVFVSFPESKNDDSESVDEQPDKRDANKQSGGHDNKTDDNQSDNQDGGNGGKEQSDDENMGKEDEDKDLKNHSKFPKNFASDIDFMYNESKAGVKNYLDYQSRGKLEFNSHVLGVDDNLNAKNYISEEEPWCILAEHEVDYYKPGYEWRDDVDNYVKINEIGYDNRFYDNNGIEVKEGTKNADDTMAKESIDRIYREQEFLREIVAKVSFSQAFEADGNGDKVIDNFVIITDIDEEIEWNSLSWPHKGSVHDFSDKVMSKYYCDNTLAEKCKNLSDSLYIGKNMVIPYNVFPQIEITREKISEKYKDLIKDDKKHTENPDEHTMYNVSILCHEALHSLGLSDYYSVEKPGYQSVGEFDVMGNIAGNPLPSNMLTYMREKMGWIGYDDYEYINDSEENITLYPQIANTSIKDGKIDYNVGKDGKNKHTAAKIVLSDYLQTGEYFIIEARSGTHATETIPFDAGLKENYGKTSGCDGDGLIIYRVNEKASYLKPKSTGDGYDMGGIEYGNMYGADEVYIFRAGDGDKLNSIANNTVGVESYALLGGKNENSDRPIFVDNHFYNMSEFGNSDFDNMQDMQVKENVSSNCSTMIYYSADDKNENKNKNSKIVLDNIRINSDGSVTFSVTLPESSTPLSGFNDQKNDEKIIKIADDFPSGKSVSWRLDTAKSGYAYIMAIRSTDRLKRLAENNQTGLEFKNFKDGEYMNYKVLYTAKIPLAEKRAKIPEFDDEALVFICFADEKGGGNIIKYVDCIEKTDLSFGQYLLKIWDPFYLTLSIIGLLILVLGIIAIIPIINSKKVKVNVKKNAVKDDKSDKGNCPQSENRENTNNDGENYGK